MVMLVSAFGVTNPFLAWTRNFKSRRTVIDKSKTDA